MRVAEGGWNVVPAHRRSPSDWAQICEEFLARTGPAGEQMCIQSRNITAAGGDEIVVKGGVVILDNLAHRRVGGHGNNHRVLTVVRRPTVRREDRFKECKGTRCQGPDFDRTGELRRIGRKIKTVLSRGDVNVVTFYPNALSTEKWTATKNVEAHIDNLSAERIGWGNFDPYATEYLRARCTAHQYPPDY